MKDRVTLLDRIGRPLLRLVGVAFLVVCVWFVIRIMWAIVDAYDAAVREGRPVPDMSGGMAGLLGVLVSALPVLLPVVMDQITRHRERMDQQARGTAPGPLASPPLSGPVIIPRVDGGPRVHEGGGLINNQSLDP